MAYYYHNDRGNADNWTDKVIHWQAHGQTVRQTDRQTDRQRGRHADRQKHRLTCIWTCIHMHIDTRTKRQILTVPADTRASRHADMQRRTHKQAQT